MNRLKIALAGLLFAAPAFAQGDGTDPNAGGTTGTEAGAGVEVGAGVGGTGMDANATTTQTAGTVVWSRVLIDRPYTMSTGKVGAYAGYNIGKITIVNPLDPTMSISGTFDGLGVGAGYGVTDKITVGGQYGFGTGIVGDNEFAIDEGSLGLFGNFRIVHDGKLFITASADFDLDLCGSQDMDGCVLTKGINAGLGARYNLSPQMAVFTGAPYGPGPIGQHLSISLESDGPITFSLPVGFMYQATPELNVHLTTSLATIEIANSGNAFFGADFIPIGVGALYSINRNLDVVGMFNLPDAKEAGFDLYSVMFGARYYTE
jgi:hypothetical protein